MEKELFEKIRKELEILKERNENPNHIFAEELFLRGVKHTIPFEWRASTEDDQPVILLRLKIPKSITDFLDILDYTHDEMKGTSKEKIMAAMGEIIINSGLVAGALHGIDPKDIEISDLARKLKEIAKGERNEKYN